MADLDFTTCSTCKYFLGTDLGSCRRFPQYQTKHQNEWCGEYTAISIQEIQADSYVELPARRGRPPKVRNET